MFIINIRTSLFSIKNVTLFNSSKEFLIKTTSIDTLIHAEATGLLNIFNISILNINFIIGIISGIITLLILIYITLNICKKTIIHIINESNNELKKHPQILEGTMLPNFNTLFLTTFKFKQSYSLIIICILITVPVITTITLRFSGVIGNILGTGLFSIIFGLFFCGTGLFWKKYKQLCTIQNEEEKNLINAIIGESLGEIFSDLIIFILIAYTSYFLLINLILIPIDILFHL